MPDEKWRLSQLCDLYGALLTDKQREALELSVNEDLSLAEIAENTGISRQGVRDQIRHAASLLCEYEEKLGLLATYTALSEDLTELGKMAEETGNLKLAALAEQAKRRLNFD